MRTILLTGTTGLIGGQVMRLLAGSDRLWAVISRPDPPITSGVQWVQADLSQSGSLSQAHLPERVDAVIHLAQSRHFREFPEACEQIHQVNVASTLELLNCARKLGASTFIYASSGGVVGHKDGPILESDPPCPSNFYQLSKLHGEQVVQSFSSFFSTIILRYFFVYGPGQTGMLIPNLLESVRNGRPITIYNERGIHLNPIHVRDAARATVRALELSGAQLLNVAGDQIVSIQDLARQCGALLGREPLYQTAQDPRMGDLVADTQQMREHLIHPEVPLSRGLSELLESPCRL